METPLDIIDRFSARWPKGFDLSLGRIRRLLGALGNPERRLPPVFHIAGTNGKGSTIAFLRAILEAEGLRVHADTSPHLVRYNERFRLADGPGTSSFVEDELFADALTRTEKANGDEAITVFELLTAAGFLLFAERPADALLLEVGLGGRFDSTNVVDCPAVSVITSISLDHQAYLGNTVEKIAFEKAGILKAGAPAVLSPNPDGIVAVVERVAAEVGAGMLMIGGQDWTAYEEQGRLVFQDVDGLLDLPRPRLPGSHQIVNAGTAIAAVRAAGFRVGHEAFERGMERVEWPARLQRLTAGAIVEAAPQGAEIWLDGGHNPGAGEVIASAMADLEERVARPLVLIAGMLATKDPVGFFEAFAGLARRVYTVPIRGSDAAREPQALATEARGAGVTAMATSGVNAALSHLRDTWSGPAPRILICGSLYLAGEVLSDNGTPPV
ncbi:folylpolyglutamate synthase/dihydrofolate synthase family protein [Pleomorphomonas sp. JP5]|uniref:bifunctional folylpolyglutamate synthase/dihydrofolate synthase n=1 Tax=Pleomorphomonas sp. JP5 TaxID=2942998 RepID=UPI0020439244|nr:folylpolyglutamate synthase/dihydrofolate synthase family protein [Pleomorphomonas sp. JP5]MCM5559652.1 bifunctional folylpolyglutamate synthase/dihydrofolate synthase [Pleomorphomonas sp. JP5]